MNADTKINPLHNITSNPTESCLWLQYQDRRRMLWKYLDIVEMFKVLSTSSDNDRKDEVIEDTFNSCVDPSSDARWDEHAASVNSLHL